jgi:hypothetical protein
VRILFTVAGILLLVYYGYLYRERKKLNTKLETLKSSTVRVFVIFKSQSRLTEEGFQLPPVNDQIKLFHTCNGEFSEDYDMKSPFEAALYCEPEGISYEIAGTAAKEFFAALKFDKDMNAVCACSGRPEFLFFSKDNELLARLSIKHGTGIFCGLLSSNDIRLTKSSQKKLKIFFQKHKFPIFD